MGSGEEECAVFGVGSEEEEGRVSAGGTTEEELELLGSDSEMERKLTVLSVF